MLPMPAAAPRNRPQAGKPAGHIEGVFLGKPDVVRLVITALLARVTCCSKTCGCCKTLLRRRWRGLDCQFHRIQFTPDLLPGDLMA